MTEGNIIIGLSALQLVVIGIMWGTLSERVRQHGLQLSRLWKIVDPRGE